VKEELRIKVDISYKHQWWYHKR